MKLWFGKCPQVDMMIKIKYEDLFMKASRGDLDHWLANPMDCVALLILFDQVPRNIYRHSNEMYSGDSKALAIVMKAFYYQFQASDSHPVCISALLLSAHSF